MKKKALFMVCAFGCASVVAQDLTSKKGEVYLPEADDWAIGFGATPFLNYVGNFFNSAATAPTANFIFSDQTIVGKMFIDEQTAYRARVRLGFVSGKDAVKYDTATVTAAWANPLEELEKTSMRNITLGVGMEKRRGKTRIQGFYGGEVLVSIGGSKTTYEYAEALSTTNGAHTTLHGQALGTTETKAGGTFGFGLRGFIGFEIFVMPKVSIAGEYGWGLMMSSTGEGSSTTETWGIPPGGSAATVITTTAPTGKSSSFGLDTDNSGGMLNIIFHF